MNNYGNGNKSEDGKVTPLDLSVGDIVLFGIEPKVPETQFGYIMIESNTNLTQNVVHVENFIEKPDLLLIISLAFTFLSNKKAKSLSTI